MSTELKPCHCGSDGPFLGVQHKEGFLSLTCPKCSRSVEAFTPEGLAEGWNELTTIPIQKTTSSENVLPLLWRPVPKTLPPFTDGLWSDDIWLALSDGRVARGQAMAKSPESAHPNPVHAWFIDDEQLEEAEIVAWMPFAVPDHPRLTIATTQQAVPTDRLCKTMQRPVAECGCPDCGSSLIDWPKHEANPATTYTEEPVVVPDCLRHFVEHEFSQLAVYADGRTPLYLTEEQYNAIRAMLVTAPAAQANRRLELSQAAADVIAERRRQIEAEGWTAEHDSEHGNGQMARAAACYALSGSCEPSDETAAILVDLAWPWAPQWWKPTTERRDLVKAGALILAEIERLDRANLRIDQEADQ